MDRMSCVSFPGRQGWRLEGMLHEPDPAVARGVCVLLLSPGIKGRVGPHRLYMRIAAALVPHGFHVLRFDFHGLGDSEGQLSEQALVDVYNAVQGGRYVDDTRAAMNWMESARGINRFVASGLCGGAISGLLAAEIDARIRSVLALGLPVALEGGPENWGQHLTRGQLGQLRTGYFRRMLSPRSWARFLGGRSSYQVIWRALRRRGPGTSEPTAVPDNTNPLFAPAFLSLLRSGRPILLIFSGADRLRYEFQEKFLERYPDELGALRGNYEIRTIDNANHVLSDPLWVDQMLAISVNWLDQHHPPVHERICAG